VVRAKKEADPAKTRWLSKEFNVKQTATMTTVEIKDRNETKYLLAYGFQGTPESNGRMLYFKFRAVETLFEARRAYALNHAVPVLSFIKASRYVDAMIHAHRMNSGGGA